ncbi:MAG TPA: methyltransferase domain-containing protein [Anaerolineales bacterium]|nr:methyltransferase domain-containing protein [Anaerolineales bacterium]
MHPETLLRLLRLALRALEVFLSRRAPQPRPPTRADKVVERVAPLAEKVLERVHPESSTARRRSRAFPLARAALLGAIVAGGTAYIVARQQRRVRDRYRRLAARLPEELLDVLAAPGGGGRLELVYGGEGLKDPATGRLYPVIDGIPDFIASPLTEAEYLAGIPALESGDGLKLGELLAPVKSLALGDDRTGSAALAGAVASMARVDWALSVPCGMGDYEIEMAHANPQARILCIDHRWDALLETRRKAREAGVANLYFARSDAALLPVQDKAVESVWAAHGFHAYAEPERALTQIARAARPGAFVAGVALMLGGPRYYDALLRFNPRLPGLRDTQTFFSLLSASGLGNLRVFREGAFVRFVAVRE